ncbi:helix-turn-helix domain-containing protein [Streptomyces scabichelini]|uniref:helix-turn-helix domain-containing protein n=1 Tax=Streptomyces scabichelini TaxID=2711217 RepID=UPI0019D14BB0
MDPVEVEAGSRRLLAEARGHQLAEARKQYGLAQKDVAARMGVSIARVSQIEHGKVATLDVVARYVEALGGRLDLVADFGDHTGTYAGEWRPGQRGCVAGPKGLGWHCAANRRKRLG